MFNSLCSEHNITAVSIKWHQEKAPHFRFDRPKTYYRHRREKCYLKATREFVSRWLWVFLFSNCSSNDTYCLSFSDLQLSQMRKNGECPFTKTFSCMFSCTCSWSDDSNKANILWHTVCFGLGFIFFFRNVCCIFFEYKVCPDNCVTSKCPVMPCHLLLVSLWLFFIWFKTAENWSGKKKKCVGMPRGSSPFFLSLLLFSRRHSFVFVCFPLHLELLLSFSRYDMLRIPAGFSAVCFYHIDLFCAAKILQTHHCAFNIQEIAKQCIWRETVMVLLQPVHLLSCGLLHEAPRGKDQGSWQ